MELSLVKGEKVSLTKSNPGANKVTAGLGWDINGGNSGAYDLDAFAFFTRGDKWTGGDSSIAYFGNKKIAGVELDKDNLTGAGEGDDEKIFLTLNEIPQTEDAVYLGVNIYEAASRGQKFGMVQNAYIRLFDSATGAELVTDENKPIRFDLSEDFGSFTGVLAAKIYRHNGEFKFQAVGQGLNGDINQILAQFK